ncbi:hypothetical protein [Novosphingobium sp.]|uniref:hypothetical protein n=1 Tax=Novosphingobium sp. TaxID=1874826 RepID=UPI002609ED8F|nr:hypothetical protein [Novosphingobium sp.]
MRELTYEELVCVVGGSVTGRWGGSGPVRWRMLDGTTSDVHVVTVYGRRPEESDGMFEDGSDGETLCQASFRGAGGFAGTAIGGIISAGLVSVELGLAAALGGPTGGASIAGVVTVAGYQINLIATAGGVVGFFAGNAIGEWAC